jgi:hypothetical protein
LEPKTLLFGFGCEIHLRWISALPLMSALTSLGPLPTLSTGQHCPALQRSHRHGDRSPARPLSPRFGLLQCPVPTPTGPTYHPWPGRWVSAHAPAPWPPPPRPPSRSPLSPPRCLCWSSGCGVWRWAQGVPGRAQHLQGEKTELRPASVQVCVCHSEWGPWVPMLQIGGCTEWPE